MKFPSIQTMIKGILNSFLRFAPALIAAIVGSTVAFIITFEPFYNNEYLYRIIFCAALGLPFFISIRLFCEKSGTPSTFTLVYYIIASLLLVGYFFTLPGKPGMVPSVRFALLIIGMHLLVSFSPFTGKGEFNGFWQFNKALFLRFLTAALFSAVLYLGLSLAILAIDKLFNAEIDEMVYLRLWIVIAGLFNTWFFLAGIPENIWELQDIKSFPKGLKIFTQYVLLPIIFIYLLILYVYLFKIIFTWNLPNGWVSYLVLYFSGAGIFSLLLVYPVKELEGNKWMKIISKWFYITLAPMLILLAIAIWKRIDQYGVTENRYFIVVLNVWLAFICLYFIISKTKSIKVIPITLCILAFLISFGPWGAFSISKNSQFRMLKKTLIDSKMLVDGKIKGTAEDLTNSQKRRIVSTVSYLDNADALDMLKPWFKPDMDTLFKKDSSRWVDKSEQLLTQIGINKWDYYYNYRGEGSDDSLRFNYYSPSPTLYVVKDYDYYFNYSKYSYSDDIKDEKNKNIKNNITYFALIGNDSLAIYFNSKNGYLNFIMEKKQLLQINISAVLEKVDKYIKNHPQELSHNNYPSDVMKLELENDLIKTAIYFSQIAGYKNKNKIKNIDNVTSTILVRLKSDEGKEQTP